MNHLARGSTGRRALAGLVGLILITAVLVGLRPDAASADGVQFVTATATLGGATDYPSTDPGTPDTLGMEALELAVPPAVTVNGVTQDPTYPVVGGTVYFSAEMENGIWFPVCSAVTDSNGDAICFSQAPSVIIDGVAMQVAAWSATYKGSFFVYSGSSDYGRAPGTPDPEPTPPDNGGIEITPTTYVSGCTPPDPSQQASLGALLTDGGNCQLAKIENDITQAVLGAASLIIGVGAVSDALELGVNLVDDTDTLLQQYTLAQNLAGKTGATVAEANWAAGAATIPALVTTNSIAVTIGVVTGVVPALAETGVLNQSGNVQVASTGSLPIGTGATIDNTGIITNDGTISDAVLTGQGAGTIVNNGTIINNGTISGNGQGTGGGLKITGNNYTLNFDVNGGPDSTPSSLVVFAPTVGDSKQSLPTVQPAANSAFNGWYTAPTGGSLVTNDTTLPGLLPTGPSTTTLYAQYTPLGTTTQASPAWAFYNGQTQSVTLTANVSGTNPVNEGSVAFSLWNGPTDEVASPVSATVANGTATATVPIGLLGAGTYSIDANYSDPSGDLESSSDDSQVLTIGTVPTTTTGTPTSFTYDGQESSSVQLQAWVTSPIGPPTGYGGVSFSILDASGNVVKQVAAGPSSNGAFYATYGLEPFNIAAGTYSVVANFSDSGGDFASSTDLGEGPIPQTFDFWDATTQHVNTSLPVGASSTSGQPVAVNVDTTTAQVCSLDSSDNIHFNAPGLCQVDYTAPAYQAFGTATTSQLFKVLAQNAVTFSGIPATPAVGTSFAVTATSLSGLAVTLGIANYTSSVCSLANGVVTILTTGHCTIQGTSASTTYYVGGLYTQGTDASMQPQSITFATPPSAGTVGSGFLVSAMSTSLSPVGFSIDPSSSAVCSITSWSVDFNAPGPCQIDASAAGSSAFQAATSSETVSVAGQAQTITFSTPPTGAVVGGTYAVSATVTSGASVALSIDPSSTSECSLSGSTVTFTAVGSCEIDASVGTSGSYFSATSSQTVSVAAAAPPSPTPAVKSVTPNSGPTTGGTSITITGTNFATGDQVVIGQGGGPGTGAAAATQVDVVSATSITAVTGGEAKAGTFNVYIIGPTGKVSVSATSDQFTYQTPPAPTVTTVTPNSGPTTGGTAITITGTGFATGDQVVIGQGGGPGTGAAAATQVDVVSATSITAVTGGGAKAGTFNVYIIGPTGKVSVSATSDQFSYQTPPIPSVTAVSPNNGPTAGGTAITVTGSGFAVGDVILIGTTSIAVAPTQVDVLSPTKITAVTPASPKNGIYNLYVISATDKASKTVTGDQFSYHK